MSIRIGIVAALCILLFSCEPDKEIIWEREELEIFKVTKKDNEVIPGELNYKEVKLYDEFGTLVQLWYYNRDDQLTTIEKLQFDKNSKIASGSKFLNTKDSLLSYYTFEYNSRKEKIKTFSYDASNDELLRIERFEYDKDGNRTKREICTALEEVIRTYEFKFDADGAEKSFKVFDQNGDILGFEHYSITKRDEEGEWIEKWGFKDDEPVSVKRRNYKEFRITNREKIDQK